MLREPPDRRRHGGFLCEDGVIEIEVPLAPESFDYVWDRLHQSAPVEAVLLGLYVDVFRSKMDRALAEYDHYTEYHIERDSLLNGAAMVGIRIESPQVSLHTTPESVVDDEDEVFAPPQPDPVLLAIQGLKKPLRMVFYALLALLGVMLVK